MDRKRSMRALVLVTISLLTAAGCSKSTEPQGRPEGPKVRPKNLLLISIDTVRADHMSCYGYERDTTPRIDAFAKRGALFANCTSPASWTVPAHLSVFTGMEAATHRCVYYGKGKPGRLNANYTTMARIFARNGFRTGAFTGGGFAGPRHGVTLGFETYERGGRRIEDNTPAARHWLEENGDQPFFLFLHGFNAHRPYLPPYPYNKRYSGSYAGSYNVAMFGPNVPKPSPVDLQYVVSQYDGEIAYIDDLVADFLEILELRGMLKDTLVVIFSDHGDEFYEHGGCDHIHTLYDELTRVPWIMVGPSIPSIEVRSHVGTLDMLPTLLTLFDLEADIPFQGVDRSDLLYKPDALNDAEVYSYTGIGRAPFHLSSVRTNQWKLITNLRAGKPNPQCARCLKGAEEGDMKILIDLAADPHEQHNVAADHPAVVADLFAKLQTRLKQCDALRLVAEQPDPPSKEYLETLESLGYVGSDDVDSNDDDSSSNHGNH